MPAGQYDATLLLNAQVDTNQLFNQVSNIAAKIKPINIRINGAGALGQISKDSAEFNKSLAASTSRVLAFGVSAGALFAVGRAFKETLKATVEVQKSLAELNIVFQVSENRLGKLSDSLFETANKTGQSWKVAGEALLEFGRQGLSVEESLKRTKSALELTRFTGLETADAVRTITTALNSFNEAGLDSAKILDKISNVDVSFAVSGKDLAEGLARVSSIAKDAGINIDKLFGLVTSAKQNTGRTGEVIATSIGTIIQRLGRSDSLDNLKQLGIQVEDVNGQFLSTDKILQNLAKTFGTLSQSQQNSVVQFAGGVRNANTLRALLSDLSKENSVYSRATITSANASGYAAERNEELNKTLSSQLNTLGNNLTKAAAGFGNISLKPVIEKLAGGINNAFSGIGDELGQGGIVDGGASIGVGLLKGLGNYLSGPGLVAAGALVGKLFLSFGEQAAKSFGTILESGGKQVQITAAVNTLLAQQPELYKQISSGQLSQLQIQEAILASIRAQNLEYAKQGQVFAATKGLISAGNLKLSNGNLALGGKIPSFANPVSSAIIREAKAGVPQSLIRVGQSTSLKNSSNPLGLGVYNLRDEPGGLNQGVSRALSEGTNPKNYNIPNFANTFGGTFGVSQTGQLSFLELKELNKQIDSYKSLLQGGIGGQKELNSATVNLANKYQLTSQAMTTVASEFKKTFNNVRSSSITNPARLLDSPENNNARLNERIRLLTLQNQNQKPRSVFLDENLDKRRVINLTGPRDSDFEKNRIRQQAKSFRTTEFEGRAYRSGYDLPSDSLAPLQDSKAQQRLSQRRQDLIQSIKDKNEQIRLSQTLTNIAPGTFGPSTEQFNLEQLKERYKKEAESFETNRRLSGIIPPNNNFIGPNRGQFDIEEIKRKEKEFQDFKAQTEERFQNNRRFSGIVPTIGTIGPSRGQFDIEQLKNRGARTDAFNQLLPFNQLNRFSLSSNTAQLSKQDFISELRKLTSSANSLPQDLRNQFLGQVRTFAKQTLETNKIIAQQKSASSVFGLGQFFGQGKRDFNALPQPIQAQLRSSLQNKAFLASIAAPLIGGVAQESFGDKTTTARGLGQSASGLGNVAGFVGTGFTLGGPYGAIAGLVAGLAIEAPKAIKAFTDTLPDLQRKLGELQDRSQKVSASIGGFIDVSEKLSDVLGGRVTGLTNFQVEQLKRERTLAIGQIPNIESRNVITDLVKSNQFDKAREVFGNVNANFNSQVSSQKLLTNFNGFKNSKFGDSFFFDQSGLATGGLTENDKKLFGPIKNTQTKILNTFANGDNNRLNELENNPNLIKNNEDRLNFLLKIQERNKQSQNFLKFSDYGQTLNSVQSSLFTAKDVNDSKFTDLLKNNPNDISKIKGLEPKLNFLSRVSKGSNDKDFQETIDRALDVYSAAPDALKGQVSKLLDDIFGKKAIDDYENGIKEFTVSSTKSVNALISLNKLLFESQRAFNKLGEEIEINGIKKISNLEANLKSGEITQSTNNQISLLTRGGDLTKNFLDFQQNNLQNNNQAKLAKTSLSVGTGNNIFDLLKNTRIDLTQGVQENLNNTFKGQPSQIKTQIDKVINEFANDFSSVSDKLKSGNIGGQDINKIIDTNQQRLGIFEKFQKLGGIPFDLQDELKKTSFGKQERFERTSKEDSQVQDFVKQYLQTKLPGTFSESELGDISKIPVEDLQSLQTNSSKAVDIYKKLLTSLDDVNKEFVTQTQKIQSDLESNNQTAATQFKENSRLISSQFAVQQDVSRRGNLIDVNNITNQGQLSRLASRQQPLESLFTQSRAQSENNISNLFKDRQGTPALQGLDLLKLGKGGVNNEINKLSNINGPLSTEQADTLQELLKLQQSINEQEKINNAELEKNKQLLKDTLAFTQDRLNAQRAFNEANARQGNFDAVKKNLGNTLSEGFSFNSNDFWKEMSDNAASFGDDFKNAFKGGIHEAITGSKSIGDAFRDILINFGTGILDKTNNLAIDTLFGSLFGKQSVGGGSGLLSGIFGGKKASGGLIKGYAKGGFVDKGSGLRDDVPALLSGGEFVVKKSSVNKIGVDYLKRLNSDIPAAKAIDSISTTNNSADVLLANEYYGIGSKTRPKKGELNVSNLLSSFGQTDENNPQNTLKFSREKYFIDLKQYQKQISAAKRNFEQQQNFSLISAYVSAGINAGGGALGNRGKNIDNTINKVGGPSNGAATVNPIYNLNGNRYLIPDNNVQFSAMGGLIQKYKKGGSVFGGDSLKDNVPAYLMGGEFVVNKDSVNRVGLDKLNYINRTGKIAGYASGGYVGNATPTVGINDSTEKYFAQLISINSQIRDSLNNKNTNSITQTDSNRINITNQITVTISDNGKVTSSNNSQTTKDNSKNDNTNREEQGKQIAKMLQGAITERLIKESSNGGILESTFKKK